MSRFDTDIVELLRWSKRYTNGHVPLVMEDAANEIERLRSALKPFAQADFESWTATGDCQIPIEDFRKAREACPAPQG